MPASAAAPAIGNAGEASERDSCGCFAHILGDMITDAEGRHTHTLLDVGVPGVLTTSISSAAASGRVIAKATRPWVPDSRLWLLPPRSAAFACGGWAVEWTGHGSSARPGWLHPAVICVALGFQALDVETGTGPWWLRRGRRTKATHRPSWSTPRAGGRPMSHGPNMRTAFVASTRPCNNKGWGLQNRRQL